MKRLGRVPVPKSLKDRETEILGEIRKGTMIDCLYNDIISVEDDYYKPKSQKLTGLLPSFLREHQIEDLEKAVTLDSVFNINKPGLGKTIETILWIKLRLVKDFKALILCPKSVIETWYGQLNRYWPDWSAAGMWWITNYEQLYNEERFNIAKEFDWDVIVLDESHNIKSMKTKITGIVFDLKSKYRHCLTGTPVKNRPEDLAAQLKWLDPYSITSYTDFREAFCHKYKDGWGIKYKGLTKDKKMVDNLQKLLDVYCVGGKDLSAGSYDKPDIIKVRLKLDPDVKKLYKKVEGEYDPETESRIIDTEGLLEAGVKVSSGIESALRRQQLASNPQLFNPKFTNIKFEWILDWLNGTDEKVVIFSRFAKTIEALELYLKSKGQSVAVVKREQSAKARQLTIETWGRSKQALLGTYGVLGEGVDGLQEHAHYSIFVDRHYNSSDNEQAEKRIDRGGQKYKPIIYILQAIGTIDIRIENVSTEKGIDIDRLLSFVDDEED